MKVRFIKDHPAGIKEGTEVMARKHIADVWMTEGYIELADEIIMVDVEKQKASSLIGVEVSKKKQSKQSKSGKSKKK